LVGLETKFEVPNFIYSSLWQDGWGKQNVSRATGNL